MPSWKRYAGVQEMMCLFNTYLELGRQGREMPHGVCGVWLVEMLKTIGQYKSGCWRLLSVLFSGEELLHSAVILEQASSCYLFAKPSMLGKEVNTKLMVEKRKRRCPQESKCTFLVPLNLK